jgi:predicted nuclease of predicted toxin-antitoxin system
MRFLVDECTGPAVAGWLRDNGHDIFSVFDEARGMADDDIIRKALSGNWILITNDKDFGDKVFRDGHLHKGIILLRLEDETANSKIRILSHLLANYPDRLQDAFIVVTEKQVRFAKSKFPIY